MGYAGRNWYARVTKAYLNNVDIYACVTQFQMRKLMQAGFAGNKLRHIPNFLEHTDEPNYSLGEYVAISGRLSKEKGIDLLLEIAARTPDIRYVFAGSPRKEEPVTLPVPDNCIFTGHLSGEKLADFYRNARFLVIASRCYEGFPMTILEAARYGKPAIAPGHAGFLEIVDNCITGLHFIPGDASDLYQKINLLWNNPDDCIRMGRQAYNKLNRDYSADVVKLKWKELFETLKKVYAF